LDFMGWQVASEELAVGAVGEKIAAAQVQGDLGAGHFDLAEGAEERREFFELEELEVASRGLFLDAAEGFDFPFHFKVHGLQAGGTIPAAAGA